MRDSPVANMVVITNILLSGNSNIVVGIWPLVGIVATPPTPKVLSGTPVLVNPKTTVFPETTGCWASTSNRPFD